MSDTPAIPQPPARLILEVRFDVDQQSDQLSYRLLPDPLFPPEPDPNPRRGGYANALYFKAGEQVTIRVVGGGDKVDKNPGFVSFQIVDCTIITKPQVVRRDKNVRTEYAPPSPFSQALSASYPLALDFSTHVTVDDEKYFELTQNWKQTLDVAYSPGLWELSMVLTVRIIRGVGEVDEVRVFSFDPEAEVGGQGTMPQDPGCA